MLQELVIDRIKTEYIWLSELRKASESWYNEITQPLMPILTQEITGFKDLEIKEYSKIARDLFEQKIRVNSGTDIKNLKTDMGERGLPFVTERDELWSLIEEYLGRGDFLKSLAYELASPLPEYCRQAQNKAIKGWEEFRSSKDNLVDHISRQIKAIGTTK